MYKTDQGRGERGASRHEFVVVLKQSKPVSSALNCDKFNGAGGLDKVIEETVETQRVSPPTCVSPSSGCFLSGFCGPVEEHVPAAEQGSDSSTGQQQGHAAGICAHDKVKRSQTKQNIPVSRGEEQEASGSLLAAPSHDFFSAQYRDVHGDPR